VKTADFPRLQKMADELARVEQQLQLTQGEQLAFLALTVAGLLKQVGSRDALTAVLGFILYLYNDEKESAQKIFNATFAEWIRSGGKAS
jgi:hypothetical protein